MGYKRIECIILHRRHNIIYLGWHLQEFVVNKNFAWNRKIYYSNKSARIQMKPSFGVILSQTIVAKYDRYKCFTTLFCMFLIKHSRHICYSSYEKFYVLEFAQSRGTQIKYCCKMKIYI